jgi:hypothetical protein
MTLVGLRMSAFSNLGGAILAAALLLAAPAFAEAPPVDAAGMLGVQPLDPAGASNRLVVRQLSDLHFGRIVPDPQRGGAVRLTPTGQKLVSGGAADLGGAFAPAEFEVLGTPGTLFRIELPPSVALGAGLTLEAFESEPKLTGTIPEGGRALVQVGATLVLAPRTPDGQYRGGFEIRVDNP